MILFFCKPFFFKLIREILSKFLVMTWFKVSCQIKSHDADFLPMLVLNITITVSTMATITLLNIHMI
jgi:hypothetical protein